MTKASEPEPIEPSIHKENKALKTLNKFLGFMLAPVSSQRILFCTAFIIMAAFLVYRQKIYADYKISSFYLDVISIRVLLCLPLAYLLCLPPYLCSKIGPRVQKAANALCMAIIVSLVAIETWLVAVYHIGYCYTTVMLLFNTNQKEAGGVLKDVLLQPQVMAIAAICSLVILAGWLLRKRAESLHPGLVVKSLLVVLTVYSCARIIHEYRYYAHKAEELDGFELRQVHIIDATPTIRLWCGFVMLSGQRAVEKNLFNVNKAAYDKIKARGAKATPLAKNIVLVIGESFNKHHTPLYNPGYRNTTPELCKMQTQGRLSVWKDVITPANNTNEFFKNMLSVHSIGQKGEAFSFPLVTTIIKANGLKTRFYTNHFAKDKTSDKFTSGSAMYATMFDSEKADTLQFDYMNAQMYPLDQELMASVEGDYRDTTITADLTIIHLMGSHFNYAMRFPEPFKKFDESNTTSQWGETAAMHVANYDNSILYNDHIVKRIFDDFAGKDAVVIYLSDHGEEVYDIANRKGHVAGDTRNKEQVRCQYDVPMMFYLSPEAREKHPELWQQITAAADKPFMSDDLSHILLYLCGIEDYYDSSRNPLCNDYNTGRKRLLWGEKDKDYDEIMSKD